MNHLPRNRFEEFLLENASNEKQGEEDIFRRLTLDVFSSKHKFPLPEKAFYLFYHIGDDLFSGANLYSPDISQNVYFKDISLTRIVDIARSVNELASLPLIAIYETERFQIPDLMVFENGQIRKSPSTGKEPIKK